MILITFATNAEAKQSIDMLNATKLSETIFRFDKGHILITGVGVHAAQQALSSFQFPYKTIWNFGFAGSLNESLALREIVCISSVCKANIDKDKFSAFPSFQINTLGRTLVTSDVPIHSLPKKVALSKKGELVDMEGYGLAYASFAMKKPLLMWKLVSDFAKNETRQLIEENLDLYSSDLAVCLSRTLACLK